MRMMETLICMFTGLINLRKIQMWKHYTEYSGLEKVVPVQ